MTIKLKNGCKFYITLLLLVFFANFSFAQKISVNFKEVPLKVILTKISDLTEYRFVYTNSLNVNEIVASANFVNTEATVVMSKLFEKNNITHTIKGKLVVLKPINTKDGESTVISEQKEVKPSESKPYKINGVVFDSGLGSTLPGVCVRVVGTQRSQITDQNGKFTISVKESDQLSFTFIGMKTAFASIKDSSNVNIQMEPEVVKLDEVIVTGYQTLSRERATGSYSNIPANVIDSKLQPSLKSILEGQSAGVVVSNTGSIEIRGLSTISGVATPLIVVDGYPLIGQGVDIETINPDNIENITILKDAVAASIYGARASNGVIVITTKKAQSGSFSATYKAVYGMSDKLSLSKLNLSNPSDYIDAEIELFNSNPTGPLNTYNNWGKISEVQYLLLAKTQSWMTESQVNEKLDLLRKNNAMSEIERYILRAKQSQQHSLNITGGTEKNLFSGSLKYTKEEGDLSYNNESRLIADINNIWKPKKWFSFRFLTNINYTKTNSTEDSYSTFRVDPYTDLYSDSGDPLFYNPAGQRRIPEYSKYTQMKSMLYHPEQELGYKRIAAQNLQTRIGGDVTIKITDELTVSGGGSWVKGFNTSRTVRDAESYEMRAAYNDGTSRTKPLTKYIPEGGRIDERRGSMESWVLRGQMNYNGSFNQNKHRVTAMVGSEMSKDTYENITLPTYLGYNPRSASVNTGFDMYAYNKNTNNIKGDMLFQRAPVTLNALSYGGAQGVRDSRFVSWYANGSYEYLDKYLLSASSRLDLTNFFGTDPKYRYRPTWSLGGTYKISKEPFFQPLKKWIERLNIRASYGINGNISLTHFPYLVLSVGSYNLNTDGISYDISRYPNDKLRWERTAITNIGFDLTTINNRVNINVDYYYKKSTDLIASDVVDHTRGVNTLSQNIGSVKNSGIEFTVNAELINRNKFNWDITAIWSHNSNKLLSYNGNLAHILNYTTSSGALVAGYPMYGMWAIKSAGLNSEGAAQFYNKAGEIISSGALAPEDAVYVGSIKATDDISITNKFTFGNFDASFMIVSKLGGLFRQDIFNGTNINNRHLSERWKVPGDELKTKYPKLVSGSSDQWYMPYCDSFISSSDFVKLRDVSVSYNLPKKYVQKLGLSSIKAYVQARNMFYITAKGVDVDPEGIFATPQYFFGVTINL